MDNIEAQIIIADLLLNTKDLQYTNIKQKKRVFDGYYESRKACKQLHNEHSALFSVDTENIGVGMYIVGNIDQLEKIISAIPDSFNIESHLDETVPRIVLERSIKQLIEIQMAQKGWFRFGDSQYCRGTFNNDSDKDLAAVQMECQLSGNSQLCFNIKPSIIRYRSMTLAAILQQKSLMTEFETNQFVQISQDEDFPISCHALPESEIPSRICSVYKIPPYSLIKHLDSMNSQDTISIIREYWNNMYDYQLPEQIDAFVVVQRQDTSKQELVPLCCLWTSASPQVLVSKSRSSATSVIQSFLDDLTSISNPYGDGGPLFQLCNEAARMTPSVGWTTSSSLLKMNPTNIPNLVIASSPSSDNHRPLSSTILQSTNEDENNTIEEDKSIPKRKNTSPSLPQKRGKSLGTRRVKRSESSHKNP